MQNNEAINLSFSWNQLKDLVCDVIQMHSWFRNGD